MILIYPVGAQHHFWIPTAPGVSPALSPHLQGFEGDLKLNATETGLENAMIKASTRDGIVQIYPLVVVYIANYGTYGTIFQGKSTFMGLVS